ncbi:DsbA family oxidoreductase [Lentibacillus sp. L22]|uniref:DsbA family oxidoreductase n=1 Tax=Lentibacillus TaxID=175304 RepID=UPI0022B0A3A5|nr:DsbA family oxidoreductase [Lentibacillus daqui]
MKIEIWSDFVCPFCYMGKRRLENALAQFPHQDKVTLEYKSYELSPNAERNPGKTIHEQMAEKFGSTIDQAKSMNDKMAEQAAELGLTYNFDSMKPTNTLDAHRVAKYAAKQGKGKEMTERLLKAYFTDGKHIGDKETLKELAEEVGLEASAVNTLLQTDDYLAKVQADEEEAKEIGVQGVPFFVFNEKYAVSGAQPAEVFSEVLDTVWEEESKQPTLQSLTPKKSKTTYCTDDGCCEIEE